MSGKKKILIITLVALIAIFMVAYFSGAFYYKDKFPKNVSINGVNVGGMTLKQSNDELAKTDSWDKIVVKSDEEDFLEIKLDQIDYKYIDSPKLPEILDKHRQWKWFLSNFKRSKHTTEMTVEYNKDKVKEMIDAMENVDTEPLNATVVYSESSNAFVVKPESNAIGLSHEQLVELVAENVSTRSSELNVEKDIKKPTIFADDESLVAVMDKANQYLNVELKASLRFFRSFAPNTLQSN